MNPYVRKLRDLVPELFRDKLATYSGYYCGGEELGTVDAGIIRKFDAHIEYTISSESRDVHAEARINVPLAEAAAFEAALRDQMWKVTT